jgi:copper chaperone
METLELRVEGMSCGHCEAAVREEVALVPGVTRVEADASTGVVTVEGTTSLDEVLVRDAIVEAGYTPAP